MAVIGEATSVPAIRRIQVPRLLLPRALAGALLALLVLTISLAPESAQSVLPSADAASLGAVPLAARPLVSSTLGRDQASYRIQRTGSGLIAANRAQGLSARFGGQGVQVGAGSDTLDLHLRAAGYGQTLRPVAPAAPAAHANRVSYRRGSLTEWYANGPLGLEQGFTLRAPPAGARTGPLTLALSLSGSLRPSVELDARSLSFAGSALRYTGLAAFDARERELPVRLALRGRSLLITVDDAGASYPITIDPWVQQAKLTASDGPTDTIFPSVAISGDTIAVGADGADVSGHQNQGAVYVFVKPTGGWGSGTQTAKLTASDGAQDDRLGISVAIAGDTIVAGAPYAEAPGGMDRGAVYVFVKPAAGWTEGFESAELRAAGGPQSYLGFSVAITSDAETIVGGAPGRSFSEKREGAAYVFDKPAGGWASGTYTTELRASDEVYGATLGSWIAISGDTIVAMGNRGAYVFVKPPTGWTDATENAKLAHGAGSVAISGDTIVTGGALLEAAYVYVEPAGGWASGTETAKLTPSDKATDDGFSASVAISGDTIVVGAHFADVAGHVNQGAAYVFVKPPGGWTDATETAKLAASDGVASDTLGRAVAIAGDTIVAGAPRADIPGNVDQGATYVFGRVPAAITLTKHLVPASDSGRFDLRVGQSVVKGGAGDRGSGAVGVVPGTYRVSESAAAGTSLAGYTSSIACTINGNPGPSVDGSSQANVTVAEGDHALCTITNKRKAQITLSKHLVPASDPGRFDLKVGQTVVKAGAGEGGSGSRLVGPGTYTLSEVAAVGTSLSDYTSSIACTKSGSPGPFGSGTSLNVSVDWGDVLACTITNRPGATIRLTKDLRPSSDPGRFDLKVAGTVVKAGAGNGGSGSTQLPAGTYRVAESAATGSSLSDYATSIVCTLNGNPGPSASGTAQLDVTVATGDVLACTFANKRKAQVTLIKHLVPASDPGRFDLKLTSGALVRMVRTGAGDGDSGSILVAPGTWTVVESAASGTSLSDYTSSVACTRNGNPGPSGNGASLKLTLSPADVLVCTLTNQRK